MLRSVTLSHKEAPRLGCFLRCLAYLPQQPDHWAGREPGLIFIRCKSIIQLDKLEFDMDVIFMKLENAELKHIERKSSRVLFRPNDPAAAGDMPNNAKSTPVGVLLYAKE